MVARVVNITSPRDSRAIKSSIATASFLLNQTLSWALGPFFQIGSFDRLFLSRISVHGSDYSLFLSRISVHSSDSSLFLPRVSVHGSDYSLIYQHVYGHGLDSSLFLPRISVHSLDCGLFLPRISGHSLDSSLFLPRISVHGLDCSLNELRHFVGGSSSCTSQFRFFAIFRNLSSKSAFFQSSIIINNK